MLTETKSDGGLLYIVASLCLCILTLHLLFKTRHRDFGTAFAEVEMHSFGAETNRADVILLDVLAVADEALELGPFGHQCFLWPFVFIVSNWWAIRALQTRSATPFTSVASTSARDPILIM